MKKSTTILLLSSFVLLLLFIVFYSMIYAGAPTEIIGVHNNDDVTYQVNIVINGENNSYTIQPNSSIMVPKESSKTSDYKIELFLNNTLQYSDTVNLQKYESLLCSIDNGILDVGEVSV